MNINPLLNISFVKTVSNTNKILPFGGIYLVLGGNKNSDTFERGENVVSQKEPELTKEKLDYKQIDFDEINNSVKEENLLGKGFEGSVFEIENSDLVVKIPKIFFDKNVFQPDEIKKELIEEEVTEQDKVNHIVKKYKNGITIMNKIPGKPITDKEREEVANLPVQSYQKLLNQIIDADKKGMEFDYATNNILYDKESGELTAIDFRPRKDKKFNPLEKLYFAFDCFGRPDEKKFSGKLLSATLSNLKSEEEQKISPFKYDYKEIMRLLMHNNPRDLGSLYQIQSCMNNIIDAKSYAESDYQNRMLDNEIDDSIEFITKSLSK